MDNKEMMQRLKKELVKQFITEKNVTDTRSIDVSLSFYSYENMVTLQFETSTSESTNISFGGLEMTIAIADTVMKNLGFTKLKSPYTGYGKRGVYLYHMD